MDFKELNSFVTVIDCGNFSKASEKLYISQPTISLHIKSLEDELHTQLFKRSTKHLLLTNKGKDLYEFAKKIISLKNDFQKNWHFGFDNIIKVGASSVPCAYVLPDIILNFKKKYKDIRFDIIQGDSKNIIDLMSTSVIDVGLIGMESNDKSIVCKSICKDKMVIITPNNDYFKNLKNKNVQINDLLKEDFILREEGSGTKAFTDKLLNSIKIGFDNLNVVAQVKNYDALINLVKSGIGISIVSEKSISSFDKNSLIVFNFPIKSNARNLNIIYSNNKNKKKLLKEFITFVKNYFI